ncbi:inositol monophosphatase family protein [Micromonospora radicis]|uniref:Inositol monophosphatase family protein n=1 Tax=Micromonospora radicis TaxID=1894971 RepID=A0A418MY56_9ACTN|nr:inositol monophosphatase family protein [Micromonospora radicis]RIV40063.1 inositol monophosphatase family protein [Micromonospora radicis]
MSIGDRELAIRAARAGAAVVRAEYGAPLTRLPKSATDFATSVDISAERAVVDLLRAARPDDLVLAEESGRTGTAGNDRTWLVDPLCGTVNYAARTMLVAVNVALRGAGRVTVAAAADPFTDEVFWTDGAGGQLRRGGVDEPLVPSAGSRLVDVNLDPPFPNGRDFRAVRLLAEPGFVERFHPRVVSTSLALVWVAAGRRAGYVTDGHPRDNVHFAAGVAICQAAGCMVTGIDGRPPYAGAGGLVVAADPPTHAQLLALVRNQRRDRRRPGQKSSSKLTEPVTPTW